MYRIEDLYMEYKQDIFRYLLGLTHNSTLSEDLLSETFVRAIRSIPTFRHNSSVKTWLFGIARNVWLQHLRNLKRDKPDDLVGLYVLESMEDGLVKREMVQRIRELLAIKDLRTQEIVKMRMDGVPYTLISQTLGVTESTARVLDFRTRKWLRSSLETEGLL